MLDPSKEGSNVTELSQITESQNGVRLENLRKESSIGKAPLQKNP